MDPNYYSKTLTAAVMKLGPGILYVIVGYFLFIKLPFWLLTKMVKQNRPMNFQDHINAHSSFKMEEYDAFISRINDQTDRRADVKDDRPKQEKARPKPQQKKPHEKMKDKPRPKEAPKMEALKATPEEIIFNLSPGQLVTKDELKKKYHDLLRTHHPDKVASLAPEFKKIAEIKTKAINTAYDRLKNKAA